MSKKIILTLLAGSLLFLTGSCSLTTTGPSISTEVDIANPASEFCLQQGYVMEIVTAADGSQSGICIFPDGSSCEEWAYFRSECSPAPQDNISINSTEINTNAIGDPSDYQGWWKYTHPAYNFSIMLPEDWIVNETTTFDPLMNGHLLSLHPRYNSDNENIRMTFRQTGEDIPLWPTGVGQGNFVPQGQLDISGEPVQRILLVCPTGEITSIWYHQAEDIPNIARGGLEIGFIFNANISHCESDYSLSGKIQQVGEMIIASFDVP